MSFPVLYSKVRELSATAQAMGALGAELRLRQLGIPGDSRIRTALQAVTDTFGPGLIDGLQPGQIATVIGQLTYALQEALDLLREPERGSGWTYDDPTILQERGRGSRAGARLFESAARQRPPLAAVLEKKCRFLDVGTGAGWLAIECAKIWPNMQIVGIDIWEPSLKLAESNIAEEGLQHRITLRRQNVVEVKDIEAFDLAFIPSMFLPLDLLARAIARVIKALVPGGYLILGMFAPGPGPHGAAVRDLLTIRCGGYPWQPDEIAERLRLEGLIDVEFVDFESTICVMLGRR